MCRNFFDSLSLSHGTLIEKQALTYVVVFNFRYLLRQNIICCILHLHKKFHLFIVDYKLYFFEIIFYSCIFNVESQKNNLLVFCQKIYILYFNNLRLKYKGQRLCTLVMFNEMIRLKPESSA
jgi:hypothetical protein